MPIQSLEEVLQKLDSIITAARTNDERYGYFAAIYQRVTRSIQEQIKTGGFDHPTSMEVMTVIFANRYFQALNAWQKDEPLTAVWKLAFDTGKASRPLVIQHLLLAMNAHINLDLAVAVSQTVPHDQLPTLSQDFKRVNMILAESMIEIKKGMHKIWPLFSLIDKLAGKADDGILDFSMSKARERAWRLGKELSQMTFSSQKNRIKEADTALAEFGTILLPKSLLAHVLMAIIRFGERGSIGKKIDFLSQHPTTTHQALSP